MAKRRKSFGSGAFAKARRGDSSGVFIIDDVTSFYTIAAKNFPSITSRALRHVSYLVHNTTKRYFANDSHGKSLNPITSSRTLDKFAGRGSTRKKKFAGDLSGSGRGLARAVKYDTQRGNPFEYLVGWASNDARNTTGPRFQSGKLGQDRVVTRAMQKFLFAAAAKARGENREILYKMAAKPVGARFKAPEREVIDPVYNKWKSKIMPIFEKRVLKNLDLLDSESYTAFLKDATAPNQNQREAVEVALGVRTRAGNIRKGRRSA